MPCCSAVPVCTTASHEGLKADIPTWESLKLQNYWHHDDQTYEMRACPHCGSTLMQRVVVVVVRYPSGVAA